MGRLERTRDSTVELRAKIVTLREQGLSVPQIMDRVNRTQIYHYVKLNREHNEEERPLQAKRNGRCGRKSALQENHLQAMENHINNTPFTSLPTIRKDLELACCKATISRGLKSLGIKFRKPTKEIYLTDQHRQIRVQFAQENLDRKWLERTIFPNSRQTSKWGVIYVTFHRL
ncbi:hypothetical protein ILUMI_19119 [Ignelater luminosus]|uniref:Transposase Tc1-like domain-containing protein n=1 Tax=Ignelater luminosus TaxID=2038154 RepID=A0A8K0G082_IGNLU|nr:hypothetical protein ILUMI_19119 [Ignelater luminosus]